MPKRNWPFADSDGPQQLKVHVNQKRVDLGVAANALMEAVYGKTRAIMFGEIKYGSAVAKSPTKRGAVAVDVRHSRPSLKQLQLNGSGQLAGFVEVSLPIPECPKAPSLANCPGCHRPNGALCSRCANCEKSHCDSCLHVCSNCCEEVCNLCSLRQYETQDESTLCFGCVR